VTRALVDGITAPDVRTLVLEAYLERAIPLSRLLNGRVNSSRVELLTGVNRKRITRTTQSSQAWTWGRAVPHIRKLILAWQSDPRFLTARRQPRGLSLAGPEPSLASLCEKHGIYVPARATLDVLRDLHWVRESGGLIFLRLRPNFSTK
jgi:hypothetical protein